MKEVAKYAVMGFLVSVIMAKVAKMTEKTAASAGGN